MGGEWLAPPKHYLGVLELAEDGRTLRCSRFPSLHGHSFHGSGSSTSRVMFEWYTRVNCIGCTIVYSWILVESITPLAPSLA